MRLRSLDLLRGSVMLLLTVVQPLIMAFAAWIPLGDWTVALSHVEWEGLRLWDLVMPCFIFMCGASVPYALPKYLEAGRPTQTFWRHLLKRVAILWVWGLIIQGNALYLDWEYLYFYTNTLQAIAAGYVITVLVYLAPRMWIRFVAPFACMALYGSLLAWWGDYSMTGNLAYHVETMVFPGGHGDPKYTWVLTTLMFGAMTLLGANVGEILKGAGAWLRKAIFLGLGAVALLLGGWILAAWVPVIKPIYTVSFTLMAMGWSLLALTLLYAVVDGLQICLGFGWVIMFGQYALVAYVAGCCLMPTFQTFGSGLTCSVAHHFGQQAGTFAMQLVAILLLIGFVFCWKTLKERGGRS